MGDFGYIDDDFDIDDVSESSQSSLSSSDMGLGITNEPFVLNLRNIKRDEPNTPYQDPKQKKLRKKKRGQQESKTRQGATSSSSVSEASLPALPAEAGKEEFYDARESYHELPAESQASNVIAPAATAALALAHSEHGQLPKISTPAQQISNQAQQLAAPPVTQKPQAPNPPK